MEPIEAVHAAESNALRQEVVVSVRKQTLESFHLWVPEDSATVYILRAVTILVPGIVLG